MKPRNPSTVITTLIASALAFLAGWSIGTLLQSDDPTMVGVALASVVGAVVWTVTRWLSIPRGTTEDKPKKQEWRTLEVVTEGGNRGDWLKLPLDDERLCTMAKYLADGKSFSDAMARMRIGRADTAIIRDELISRGLLRWKNHSRNQGVLLTGKGRATMKGLANGPG